LLADRQRAGRQRFKAVFGIERHIETMYQNRGADIASRTASPVVGVARERERAIDAGREGCHGPWRVVLMRCLQVLPGRTDGDTMPEYIRPPGLPDLLVVIESVTESAGKSTSSD
jgi:hypothetical protein